MSEPVPEGSGRSADGIGSAAEGVARTAQRLGPAAEGVGRTEGGVGRTEESLGRTPEPGAELNPGEATVPRPAATVILLRGGAERLELLMVRRNPAARFMGGAWVFPGGSVDRSEGEGQQALRAAALRELREEAGIELGAPAVLVPFTRWITPAQVRTRFDTWFYLAPAPEGAEPQVDGSEVVAARWITPPEALAAGAAGDLQLAFPTVKQLEQLSTFESADHLLREASLLRIEPIEPRVLLDEQTPRIVLPGEPGYER